MVSTPPLHHLFHPDNASDYLAAIGRGADFLAARLGRTSGPATGLSAFAAAERVGRVDLDQPLGDTGLVLAEVSQLWLDDTIWFHEPTYAAHLNCPVVIPALLAEVFVSGVNASLDTFDQSVGGTFIERELVDWTAHRIGFGDGADGIFTSGGTQSNLQALLIARDQADAPAERLRILASTDSHFSVQKAARLLGLGDAAVVAVPTDALRRLDLDALALALALAEVVDAGLVPMAVVATAGTTDFGAIDPLPGVARLCERYGAWLHVDAAYGGGLLASRRRRHLLGGIERADSVTVDYHKTWFQPVSSSALLVQDARTLGHVTWHADYLNPRDAAHPNQVDKSLQTTRRFDALKLWMTLRTMGPDLVGDYFDAAIDLAHEVHETMATYADVELATQPQLSTLVFRYRPAGMPEAEVARINTTIRARLYDSGRAMVAATKVDGRAFLKFTLLNPKATAEDVLGIVEQIREIGAELVAERIVGRDLPFVGVAS